MASPARINNVYCKSTWMNHADILISVGLVLRAFSSEDLITLSVYVHLNQREIKSCICSHEIQMIYSINLDVNHV